MKATDLLRSQHRELEQLFDRIETTTEPAERREAAAELADRLAAHWGVANDILYPACFEVLEDGERVRDIIEGHALVGWAAHRLGQVGVEEVGFDARLRTLRELVLRHVQEEEDELLAMADEAFDEGRLEAMGERVEGQHGRMMAAGAGAVLAAGLSLGRVQQPMARRPARAATASKKRTARKAAGPAKKTTRRATAGRKAATPKRTTTAAKGARGRQAMGRKGRATKTTSRRGGRKGAGRSSAR
jgi:hypothetical protein